jgi:hypothetical protein
VPEKIVKADASALGKVEAPKKAALQTIVPPAPKAAATSIAAAQSVADPQADLKTAIPDIARLVRTGALADWYRTYRPPAEYDADFFRTEQELQDQFARDAETGANESLQAYGAAFANAIEDLETQTPVYNAAGDEATFQLDFNVNEPDSPDPAGPRPVTFQKIGGKWYIESGF